MIAHIRQPKGPDSANPIIRARQMVAETLLPDESGRAAARCRHAKNAAFRPVWRVRLACGCAGLLVLAVRPLYKSRPARNNKGASKSHMTGGPPEILGWPRFFFPISRQSIKYVRLSSLTCASLSGWKA